MRNSGYMQGLASAVGAALIAAAALIPLPAIADSSNHDLDANIGEWTARWWKWALGIPADRNPLTDASGTFCAEGQKGPVWFLAGWFGAGNVERNCTIPKGRSILFPIYNWIWVQTSGDVPTNTEADYRQCAAGIPPNALGCEGVAPVAGHVEASLDGVPVFLNFETPITRTQSPLFHVKWRAGNIFGVDPKLETCAKCGEAVSDGYWVALPPLKRGTHVLKILATDGTNERQNITYRLLVD